MHNYEGFSRQDFGFSTILQYIQQNYRTVSLSSLADTFHFSEAHLSKLIQHNMNESFTEVLRQLRMNHAVELLIHTTMKISEIADAVGYVSIDHFTRTFRRTFGLTPRAYRAMHRPDAVPDHP
jgi:YesN/AraC family two-component response regulator